jgi:hypothetical protein
MFRLVARMDFEAQPRHLSCVLDPFVVLHSYDELKASYSDEKMLHNRQEATIQEIDL